MKTVRMVQQVAVRSLVVFVVGLVWFLFSPFLFIWGLPQFGFYVQWMSNYGTNTGDVYQFWTVLPEVLLFFFGIFWAGGIFEWVGKHIH